MLAIAAPPAGSTQGFKILQVAVTTRFGESISSRA
jgi:hypothetical protein